MGVRGSGRGGGRTGTLRRGVRTHRGPPSKTERFLEIFRLCDTTNWVTPKGDYRSILSGLIGIIILLLLIGWLSVQMTTKAYTQTDAACTCLPLDSVRVNENTLTIEAFPEVYTRKICADHAEGQFCSESCLQESATNFLSELCDPGTFGCRCLDDGTCKDPGHQCSQDRNECGLPPNPEAPPAPPLSDVTTANAVSNASLALFHENALGSNSVAIKFCVEEFQRKVAGILNLLGLPEAKVNLTDEEMDHFRRSARCVASWTACNVPTTPVQQLNIIGSTWGWATLFVLPVLMAFNCYFKSRYHGLGAPDYGDNDSDDERRLTKHM